MPKFQFHPVRASAIILILFSLGFSIYSFSYAWVEPNQTPPSGNIAAPLHTGTTSQTKQGFLTAYGVEGYYPGNGAYGVLGYEGWGGYFNGGVYTNSSLIAMGNVGIGTTSPGAKLELKNPGSWVNMKLINDRADNGPGNNLEIYQEYNSYIKSSNKLILGAGGNDRATIIENGNVGIGTASPSYKLQVTQSVADWTIHANGTGGYGLLATGSQYAGYFQGLVQVMGNLAATGVVYSDNSFRIGGNSNTIMDSNQFYCNNGGHCHLNYSGTGPTYIGNSAGTYITGTAYANGGQALCQANGVNCPAGAITNGVSAGLPYTSINNDYGNGWPEYSDSTYGGSNFSNWPDYADSAGSAGSLYNISGYYAVPSGLTVLNVVYANQYNCMSDIELKKDIKPIGNALDKILQIKGVSFTWKDEEMGTGNQVGVIAQDVEKVLPEVVTTNEQGLKAVDYSKLTPLIIESIKDLKIEKDQDVNNLREKIDNLEANERAREEIINDLKRRIEALESK